MRQLSFHLLSILVLFLLSIDALSLNARAFKSSLSGALPGLLSNPRSNPYTNRKERVSAGATSDYYLQPFVDAISSVSSDIDYDDTSTKQKPTSTCASSSDITSTDILNWLKATSETPWTQELLSQRVSIVPRERLRVAWRAVATRLGWAC